MNGQYISSRNEIIFSFLFSNTTRTLINKKEERRRNLRLMLLLVLPILPMLLIVLVIL